MLYSAVSSFLIAISLCAPVSPRNLRFLAAQGTVKMTLLVTRPAGVVILTGPVTAPAGTTAVIKPLAFTVNLAVLVVPLKITLLVLTKLAPAMTTLAPTGAFVGKNQLTTGFGF